MSSLWPELGKKGQGVCGGFEVSGVDSCWRRHVPAMRRGLWEERAEGAFESSGADGQYAGAGVEGEGGTWPQSVTEVCGFEPQ